MLMPRVGHVVVAGNDGIVDVGPGLGEVDQTSAGRRAGRRLIRRMKNGRGGGALRTMGSFSMRARGFQGNHEEDEEEEEEDSAEDEMRDLGEPKSEGQVLTLLEAGEATEATVAAQSCRKDRAELHILRSFLDRGEECGSPVYI